MPEITSRLSTALADRYRIERHLGEGGMATREEEIRELEGLFRQIYAKDSRANNLNKQRGFKKLKAVPKFDRESE